VLSGALAAGVGTAHAKSLGGMTAQTMLGKSLSADAITDRFDETNNISLNNTTTANGDVWSVTQGTIKVASSGVPLAGTIHATVVPAQATIPGTVNASVGGTWTIVGGTKNAGLVLNAAGAASKAATFLDYNRGSKTLTLQLLSTTGVATTIGTVVNNLILGTTYFLLTYQSGVYKAYCNGTLEITATLTTLQRTQVESYSQLGVRSVDDTATTFDDFQAFAL
jgi:hypothetical protein